MNNFPLISVIVPTHNRRNLLPIALKSLLDQSYKNLEIVLVNDAGEDVGDIVNYFGDNRIKYFTNLKNLGLAGTRNVGLRHSTGEYISLLDDDDFYLKYALEFRMDMMQKLGAEIVYTRALQNIMEKVNGQYQTVHKQLYWDSEFNKDLILVQNIAPCLCPLFSRRAWEDSGYWFDETMTTTEDHDFWCALSRKYDFHELKLIDCECTYRNDKTQMTGSLDFFPNWVKMFKKWRETAEDLNWVTNAQNGIIRRVGKNPADYGL